MYISVLQGDIGRLNWVAVQWNANLPTLLANNTFDSGNTNVYAKSAGDTLIKTGIDLQDTGAGAGAGTVKANVYQIP